MAELDDGTVSLAPINKAVPEDVRKLVEDKQAAIVKGEFDYWKGPLKDNTGKEVVADGATLKIADINGMNWLIDGVVGKIPSKYRLSGADAAAREGRIVAPLVALRGITKTFGHVIANDQVTFDIHGGRVLALLGENGSRQVQS